MSHNDRGYGLGRAAGGFPVVKRQKEMRAQRLRNARQPANEHRRVLWASSLLQLVCFSVFAKILSFPLQVSLSFQSNLAELSKCVENCRNV
jgi:hypothetical protein